MAEKGLPRVTVREVAQRAGVGAALVNYYFGSKTGLFRAIIEQVILESRGRLEKAAKGAGSIADRIRSFIHELVGAGCENPYLPRLMMEQVLFADDEAIDHFAREFAAPNLALLQDLLREGTGSGELRDVDPTLVVPSMLGSCIYFFLAAPLVQRLYYRGGITAELYEAFAETTADLVLRGLLAPRPTP
jgi:TetR/AcrR family transcriptional regulator